MAKDIRFKTFVYPGCIKVCNGSANYVNGNLPEIARIFSDRHIEWSRKRITEQMRAYVEDLAKTPHIGISTAQSDQNFFD
jgi:uncharacterized protein YdaU (DUF1376 family)